MSDNFLYHAKGLEAPADTHRTITPGTTALDPKPRALYFNSASAGTITVEDAAGTSIVYQCQPGAVIPFRATKVTAVSTGAAVAWE